MRAIRFLVDISFISMLCALVGTQDIEAIRGRNFSESIEKNDLYIRTMEDFEWTGCTLYFLDSINGKIIEVDSRSGKTIREISRKGQGPAELMYPIRIRLKNQKLLILDQGNRALKIFDISGRYIGQFKPSAFNNPYFYKTFDVNQKDEIFFPEPDFENGTLVTVYDLNGNKLRNLISCEMDRKDLLGFVNRANYGIGLDSDGGIYLNFPLLCELWRCSSEGKILWKKHIENPLLNQAPDKGGAKFEKNGTISFSTFMRSMEITPEGKALLGHFGGGCLVNQRGETERVLNCQTWNDEKQEWMTIGLAVYRINKEGILGSALRQSYWLNFFALEDKR